jgi:hypothetical protein
MKSLTVLLLLCLAVWGLSVSMWHWRLAREKKTFGTFTGVFFAGCAASILLACSPLVSWGSYTHAPSFTETKLYSVVDGKLAMPRKTASCSCATAASSAMTG